MAARPGRDPAAQGRVLEALREMAQAQRVRLKLRLERRTKDPGFDARGTRGAVYFQHPVEVPQIEGDRRPTRAAVEPRLNTADDTAAAERNECRLRASRPIDRRRHLDLVSGVDYDIGSVIVVADETARIVRKRFAVGMEDPVVSLARAARRQGRRRNQARPPQLDLRDRRRRHLVKTVDTKQTPIAIEGGHLLLGRQSLTLPAPAEMFEPRLGHSALLPSAPAAS